MQTKKTARIGNEPVKRAPVKEPKKLGAWGANVARTAPAASGKVIMPPGMRSMVLLMGIDMSAGTPFVIGFGFEVGLNPNQFVAHPSYASRAAVPDHGHEVSASCTSDSFAFEEGFNSRLVGSQSHARSN
jgi:hypothetical protein